MAASENTNIYNENEHRDQPKFNEEMKILFHQLWYPTPLVKALYEKNMDKFDVALINSHNVNEDIGSGWTVLHVAAYFDDRIEFLEKLVTNPLVRKDAFTTSQLQRALHLACFQGNLDVVRLLGNALLHENNEHNYE